MNDDEQGADARSEATFETAADYLPHVAVGVLLLATVLGGVLLAPPGTADDADGSTDGSSVDTRPSDEPSVTPRAPEPDDPDSFLNVLPFVGGVLLGTLVLLAALRFGGLRIVRGLFVLVFGLVIAQLVSLFAGLATAFAAGAAAAVLVAVYPEWYVLDGVAVLAGAFLVSQFGRFAGPLPMLVLLVVAAAYDAYSVYGSGHMEALAEKSGELLVPMMYVVPRDPSFSLRDGSASGDAHVAVLGLGDAVFPGLLAVSGGHFLDAPPLLAGTALNLPALGALVGCAVGYVVLVGLVVRVRRAHAGLPVLNATVVAGYLVGALAAGVPLAAALGL